MHFGREMLMYAQGFLLPGETNDEGITLEQAKDLLESYSVQFTNNMTEKNIAIDMADLQEPEFESMRKFALRSTFCEKDICFSSTMSKAWRAVAHFVGKDDA